MRDIATASSLIRRAAARGAGTPLLGRLGIPGLLAEGDALLAALRAGDADAHEVGRWRARAWATLRVIGQGEPALLADAGPAAGPRAERELVGA
ncbi:MAG: hypothetical protein AB7V42_06460 [Thermoleophilia bacterium]